MSDLHPAAPLGSPPATTPGHAAFLGHYEVTAGMAIAVASWDMQPAGVRAAWERGAGEAIFWNAEHADSDAEALQAAIVIGHAANMLLESANQSLEAECKRLRAVIEKLGGDSSCS